MSELISKNNDDLFKSPSISIFCSVDEGRNVMFGGDLNMRDKELQEVGGLPPGARDCWEACGRRKEAEFTWDISRFGIRLIKRFHNLFFYYHNSNTGVHIIPSNTCSCCKQLKV